MNPKITLREIMRCHTSNQKIVATTAYDYTFAKIADPHVDLLLVGDSLGNVIQGHTTTLGVTLGDILYHSRAVARAASHAMVVADLPFLSYQPGAKEGLLAAGRLVKESGVAAVKLEGGRDFAETVRFIVRAGIPVMGHLGLTPQFYHQLSGHRIQGRDPESADEIRRDAEALQDAGVFAIVLEGIPAQLAAEITESVNVPTIGIGAGVGCSGQILVIYDLLGLTERASGRKPKMIREFLDGREILGNAVAEYTRAIRDSTFPSDKHSFS